MKVGIVGWRGMVGSVLMQRMQEEGDFAIGIEPVFFSTSQAGQPAPMNAGTLKTSELSIEDIDHPSYGKTLLPCARFLETRVS